MVDHILVPVLDRDRKDDEFLHRSTMGLVISIDVLRWSLMALRAALTVGVALEGGEG